MGKAYDLSVRIADTLATISREVFSAVLLLEVAWSVQQEVRQDKRMQIHLR
jgi:hypothetical protein